MTTFLFALVAFALVLAGMAVGVAVTGRRLRGSCGLSAEDCACSALQARNCPNRAD